MEEKLSIDDAQKVELDSQCKVSSMSNPKIAVNGFFSFNKKEIDKVFSVARAKAKLSGFTLLQAPIKDVYPIDKIIAPPHGKLLIIISQKSGNACARNRLKRRIKAIFYQEHLYQKPVITLLIAYKDAMDLSFEQIRTILTEKI